MPIDETAIRQWADRHECRRKLPILVRRLIRETTPSLSSLRFPGNEAIDLPGLDGQCDAEHATPWVPKGRSIWEMGANDDPKNKADSDFRKRTEEVAGDERAVASFVFVTPRRWVRKEDWLAERRREGDWSAVHAYDAIDLETWLAEAPVTSRWLGEMLGMASPSLLTPQEWWQRWSTASNPPISTGLVATRRQNESGSLLKKLRDGDRVVSVQADDRSEAVAFIVATLMAEGASDLLDRTLVVTSGGGRLPSPACAGMIAIADIPDGADYDFGDRRNITIVRPYPRGRLDVQEAISLSHVPSQAFRSELEAMGYADDAALLARKTGHSVPVLRRYLSKDPEVRRPVWARDRARARQLLPFALTGSWVEREPFHDDIVLQLLGQFSDHELTCARDDLLACDDAPIARYDNINIVVSQIDALFAIGPYVDRVDIERFFQLLPELLGERDPALDLSSDQWWMANALGKARKYSGSMISGICDALCILSIRGAEICGNRLNLDLSFYASKIVASLMRNASDERWLSIRGYLRPLAEAAPNTFLECLEEELQRTEPAIRAIMGVTDGPMTGECLRTGLLWALESLAWHQSYFARVARIIFDLQRFELTDNWGNSPKSTAQSLFRAWLPATSVGVMERMQILRELSKIFRSPAMDVCISLLPDGFEGGVTESIRPQWRAVEQEVPVPTNADVLAAAIDASRLLLDLAPYSKAELDKLIEISPHLHPDDLMRLVKQVENWSSEADHEEKASLRHQLRCREVFRAYQEGKEDDRFAAAIRRMKVALEPATMAARHRWLFDNAHVEWRSLVEEDGEQRLSWKERDARVRLRRAEALAAVREEVGDDEVLVFGLSAKHPELVAEVLMPPASLPALRAKWAERVLLHEPSAAADIFLRASLWTVEKADLQNVVSILSDRGILSSSELRRRLARNLPGTAAGWGVAEELGREFAQEYWSNVTPVNWNDTAVVEVAYAADKLLEACRPRSAFWMVCYVPGRIAPEVWERILQGIARGQQPDGRFPDGHHLDEVFACMDGAEGFTDARIANLELPFIKILCRFGHKKYERTLAVHRELARDPSLFIQLLCWRYPRRDGNKDPGEEHVPMDRRKFLAELAMHTLRGWNHVPGVSADGTIDEEEFTKWSESAMRQASDADRKEGAETQFSALLARFARHRPWDDWLPITMLSFLDRPENRGLRDNFHLGVLNARGVTSRGPYDGGDQERRLGARYRALSARYGNAHPRVAALLVSIAEGYEREARRYDERAAIGERWHP